MTFSAKVGTIATPTSAGNQTISGLGFTPVAVIIWGVEQSGTGFATTNRYGIGVSAYNAAKSAYQQGAVACASTNGGGSGGTDYENSYQAATSFIIYAQGVPGSVHLNGIITTMDSSAGGRFIINWTVVQASSYTLNYLAIGGSDITGAGVLQWQQPTTASNKAVSGLGFKPSCVFHIGEASATAPPGQSGYICQHQMGVMTSTDQWAFDAYRARGEQPHLPWMDQRTNRTIVWGTGTDEAEYYSLDNDGFTTKWDYAYATACYYFSLCLAGVTSQVGHWDKSTGGNGSTDTITTTGMTPVAVIAMTNSKVASASNQNGMRWSFGASDGTNNGAAGATSKYNVNTSVDYKFSYTDKAIVVNDSDTATPDALGTIGSFASGSFVVTWGTNNAVATQICYIALGILQADITMPEVTATVAPSANVPLVGVSPSAVAAVVISPVSNVPLVGVGPPGVTGSVGPVLNVPLISVRPPDVTGSVGPSAYAP